ncbi:MAG: glycogen/starch/alpha-glucan phosphorylase [Oscillospiraceae bacterium]
MQEYMQELKQTLNKAKQAGDVKAVYQAVSKTAIARIQETWQQKPQGKQAAYFSAEFLIGRVVYANLFNLGLLEETKQALAESGLDPNLFEEIDDAALGNGGLGRLAACFLDSAATENIALNGYGIRYRYGLFRQYFEEGFQKEEADNWLRFGDPWSVRREEERVLIRYADQSVWAVPYDMPVIGYKGKTVNTLCLWQAEPLAEFDFEEFNKCHYDAAYREKNAAEAISGVLYPNDESEEGKRLRLKQQYFFSAASLQSMLKKYKGKNGSDFAAFAKSYAIQLNDTHPVVAIPELLRILMAQEGLAFEDAFTIVKDTFAYTNHTIMAEALEKWDVSLFSSVIPDVYPYVVMLQNHLHRELTQKGVLAAGYNPYFIIEDGRIHMARMAVYATHSINGVAALHTEILKQNVLKEWYALYPERFSNKTNGITQRRWLGLCNPELSHFITERIGDGWLTNLNEIKKLEPYANDSASLRQFAEIKAVKKRQLADHVRVNENGFELNVNSVFDIQIKRLHEYKRQLLNAFSILDIYFALKNDTLQNFAPMTFLFGAKSAPGYRRAKGIIKFINEIAKKVNTDPDTKDKLQVLFVHNYNVSYAEKLIPAADLSEQISTAGTEASGTGNMKLMLNGAATLGTYDGATVEIVEESGEENNFIFGARVEEIEKIQSTYDPKAIYLQNSRIRRVLDTLVDGTLGDGGTGLFRELYSSILEGASWHKADQYYLLLDFEAYVDAKLKANSAFQNVEAFAKMGILNTANAGKFSSDRTIRQYAKEIWGLL